MNTSAHSASPSGWSTMLKTAVAWVWSTKGAGMKACSSISTDGTGASGSRRSPCCTRTKSSSLIVSRVRKACNGASRTAGRPAGSIVPMSQPEPLT